MSNLFELQLIGTYPACVMLQFQSLFPLCTLAIFSHVQKQVSKEWFSKLVDYQTGKDLKLAPKLSKAHVEPSQYQKMSVKLASQVNVITRLKFSCFNAATIYSRGFCNNTGILNYGVFQLCDFIASQPHHSVRHTNIGCRQHFSS